MRVRTFTIALLCLLLTDRALIHAQTQLAMATPPAEERGVAGAGGVIGTAAFAPILAAVTTSIEVHADDSMELEPLSPSAVISQKEIQSAAGTFGDFTRYLQVLPGVVGNSDLSNEVLVRGGHPTENLFVVDGIEVPNLNHFALSGSNGGFTSMLDSAVIGSVDLTAGTYDAAYSSRLSSLIEVHTKQPNTNRPAGEISVGIAGAGGFYARPLTSKGTLLVSAHRSIINLITNDVGINGSPVYTNAMMRAELAATPRDHLSLLALGGSDSIEITPCPSNARVTSVIQMQYSGWRTTEGLKWDHSFSDRTGSILTASHSVMSQEINQQQQIGYLNHNGLKTCNAVSLSPVYHQNSQEAQSALDYEVRTQKHGWVLSTGASVRLLHPNDSVVQPADQLSPFTTSTTNSDAVNFHRNFYSGATAIFAEAEGPLGARWRAMVGVRAETFALNGSYALNPRASFTYRINSHQSLHFGANLAAQLPPLMDLLTYTQNKNLRPITVQQESVGMRVLQADWGTIDIDAYQKQYHDEPVSTEYPQLMLANMIDTIGQQFIWLPLKSAGSAVSRGIEVALRAHAGNRMQLLTSATYARTSTRALDGVRRPGNYDVPLVINVMGTVRLPWKLDVTVRESLSSGRLYTPFDLAASNAQSRGIYDLAHVNGTRGPLYSRLDLQIERNIQVGSGTVNVQIGAENVLNRSNFYGYTWLNNCKLGAYCAYGQEPMVRVNQMGLYPVISARYKF